MLLKTAKALEHEQPQQEQEMLIGKLQRVAMGQLGAHFWQPA